MRACMQVVLINLALHDDVGCGSGEGGRSANARSITNTKAHAFRQQYILLLPLLSALLCLWAPDTRPWRDTV